MHELFILAKLNQQIEDKPFQSIVDRQKRKLGFAKLTILNQTLKQDKTKVEDPVAAMYGFYLFSKQLTKPMEHIFYAYLSDRIPDKFTAMRAFLDAAEGMDPDTKIQADLQLIEERDNSFRLRLSEDL